MELKDNGNRTPQWWVALIPITFLVGALFFVIRFFGADALDGASQVALVLASGVTIAIATVSYKVPWKTIEDAITGNIASVGTSLLILILIGAISGSWMISGIVPTLIYYGLKVITPEVFLFACCFICAFVSLMTGSSWTTIATVGVALIGIGMAHGYSAGWAAGAIISGAYFGDKISPLSDTTVLASSSAGTPLFTHIKYMLITTVPSFLISCIVFLLVSIFHKGDGSTQALEISQALKSSFHISPWLLTVPVITGILIAKKLPALMTLAISAVLAGIAALVFQPDIIYGIGTDGTGDGLMHFREAVRGVFITFYGDTAVQTGNGTLDELIATHGMTGMMATILLILCAVTFGGTLSGSGMLQSLTLAMASRISRRTSLVSSTVGTGIACNMLTGDQYLSIILTCSMFKELYEEKGYAPELLSRSTEDSATVTSVLIPWNSCGMTQATVLRVPTPEYLPYCLFNLISPLMSILIVAAGYRIARKKITT